MSANPWKTSGSTRDFDRRMLEMVGEDTVKARRISLTERLKPLFKAAAISGHLPDPGQCDAGGAAAWTSLTELERG